MSVTNFENYTHELTDQELEILPIVIHGFRAYKKKNPIKAELIVKRMNQFLADRKYKIRLTGPRLRKLVNYIRSNSLLPLIATSQGYFTTDCKQTIQEQIKSLQERANSIDRCARGLNNFL